MAVDIHPLVEDAHHINVAIDKAVKNDMRAGHDLHVAWPNIITCPAPSGVGGNRLNGGLDGANVSLGLGRTPMRFRVFPNLV